MYGWCQSPYPHLPHWCGHPKIKRHNRSYALKTNHRDPSSPAHVLKRYHQPPAAFLHRSRIRSLRHNLPSSLSPCRRWAKYAGCDQSQPMFARPISANWSPKPRVNYIHALLGPANQWRRVPHLRCHPRSPSFQWDLQISQSQRAQKAGALPRRQRHCPAPPANAPDQCSASQAPSPQRPECPPIHRFHAHRPNASRRSPQGLVHR